MYLQQSPFALDFNPHWILKSSFKRLLFVTIYPLLLVLCIPGVHTEGTILPLRPDRRLYGRDRCQRILLPTACHPACAGYVLRHLRAKRTLTLPGQSLCVCVSARYCVCALNQAQTVNQTENQLCFLHMASSLFARKKIFTSLKKN